MKKKGKGRAKGDTLLKYIEGEYGENKEGGIHWGGRGISVLGTNRQAVANFSVGYGKGILRGHQDKCVAGSAVKYH